MSKAAAFFARRLTAEESGGPPVIENARVRVVVKAGADGEELARRQ